MKLGIMQPYFFPYLGYFSLMEYSDIWVIFDEVQYIRHGWINRNRVLKPGEGWQYISIQLVKNKREALIKDVEVKNGSDWKERILRQLEHYKKRAPYYDRTVEMLNDILSEDLHSVSSWNKHILNKTCAHIGISLDMREYDHDGIDKCNVKGPGYWSLEIAKQLRATEYVNPAGATEMFDKKAFSDAGVELTILKNDLKPYDQRRKDFIEGLSILDVLMFNSPEETLELVKDFAFE